MKISLIHKDNVTDDKKLIVNAVQGEMEVENMQEVGWYACNGHIALAIFNEVEFNPSWSTNANIIERCSGKINRWKYLSNVNRIEFLSFDFDAGKHKSADIHDYLSEYNHVIVGSKNHLKHKLNKEGKPDEVGPIERFHVFIPTDRPIVDVGLYKYIVRKLKQVANWTVDEACEEASHYYFQHSCQLFDQINGKNLNLDRFIEAREKEKSLAAQKQLQYKKLKSLTVETSALEQYKRSRQYKELVTGGIMSDGERYNNSSRYISCMKHVGLTLNEVLELFDEHSSYGSSFTRESVIRRYNSWS